MRATCVPGLASVASRLKIQALAILQNTVSLAQALALRYELGRRGRIEFKHVVMAGNNTARSDVVSEFGGLRAIEVAGDPAFRFVTVDWKQSQIDLESAQRGDKLVVQHRVAAVVNSQRSPADDIAKKAAVAVGIAFDDVVGSSDTVNFELAKCQRCTVVQIPQPRGKATA